MAYDSLSHQYYFPLRLLYVLEVFSYTNPTHAHPGDPVAYVILFHYYFLIFNLYFSGAYLNVSLRTQCNQPDVLFNVMFHMVYGRSRVVSSLHSVRSTAFVMTALRLDTVKSKASVSLQRVLTVARACVNSTHTLHI